MPFQYLPGLALGVCALDLRKQLMILGNLLSTQDCIQVPVSGKSRLVPYEVVCSAITPPVCTHSSAGLGACAPGLNDFSNTRKKRLLLCHFLHMQLSAFFMACMSCLLPQRHPPLAKQLQHMQSNITITGSPYETLNTQHILLKSGNRQDALKPAIHCCQHMTRKTQVF